MPATQRPTPEREPPRGVPRWLWPPPGAVITRVRLIERVDAAGAAQYERLEGDEPEALHWRALLWLLDEHPRAPLPEPGTPFEGEVVLEIARTEMPGGRVGHAYALNGGPLGAPAADGARGVLWRIAHLRTT
ncbi:MAG: hypothetical protein QNJ98_01335 [Planctomycetota bacterium]|nr:hypothetical protein [Planctomycetota bacterium]